MFWKKLDLEVSLKPFADHSEAGIRAVGKKIFSQWRTLIENAEEISLMFWAADGSEIHEYNGKMEDRFEWCKWIGVANPHGESSTLPREQQTIHAHPRYYMENPPEFNPRMQEAIKNRRSIRKYKDMPVSRQQPIYNRCGAYSSDHETGSGGYFCCK